MDQQRLTDATAAWQAAAQQFSYTAEATSFFADTAKRSELATLQLADLSRLRTSADPKNYAQASQN